MITTARRSRFELVERLAGVLLAYIHDFSACESAARTDLRAVETLGAALWGTDRSARGRTR